MTKREWVGNMVWVLLAALSAPLLGASGEHPNIVYINIDDMGWKDLSCMGSEYYETPNIDRLSLVPLLTGEGELPERPLFWHFPIYLQNGNKETHDKFFRTRPGSVIRRGDWKLHEYFEDGRLELYNLSKDLGEKHNLVEEMPEKANELHEVLLEWRKKSGASVPTKLNPQYEG